MRKKNFPFFFTLETEMKEEMHLTVNLGGGAKNLYLKNEYYQNAHA